MTMSKKLISVILVITLIATTICMSGLSAFAVETNVNASEADTKSSLAAQEIDKNYAVYAVGEEFGAIYSPESTTFRVWSPTASKVSVNLFATGSDSEEGAENLGSYELKERLLPPPAESEQTGETGIWEVTVEKDLKNVYYTYSITTTNTTGDLPETTYETQDVYSKAVGVNGDRSMVVDLNDTDPEGWADDKHILLNESTDASIWEIQIKDFSYNPNSGVSEANRGKYLAFTETGTTLNNEGKISTGIDYLKELGITTVHINPFYDFGSIKESDADADSQYNWGYDPKNYNVPEGSYSSNPYDGNVRIKECKQMIMALHNAGIQVVMDVVYNHTQDTSSSFQKTVPDYYYRKNNDGSWSSGSGCGNDTASERAMFRKFMIESCAYWANEYHVDGFRFDLMGLHDVETMNAIRDELDKIDTKILMYGEPWDLGTTKDSVTCEGTKTYLATQQNIKRMSDRIAAFNDKIRDGLKGSVFEQTGKGFVQGQRTNAKDIAIGVRANTVGNNGWQPAAPSQCVTYASCHDNATLYDRLVYSTKGANADFTQRYNDLIEMNKLTAAITMTSQGINFMLAGEEMGRTKQGDENSYSSAATLNMLDWEQLVKNADLVSYYKGLLKIRHAFSPFTDSTMGSSENYTFSSNLTTATNVISYTVSNSTEGEWNKVVVIYNGGLTEGTANLADTSVNDWVIIANDKEAGLTSLGEVTGTSFKVPASSAIIAVDKESFESAKLNDDLGKVVVKSVVESTGEVLSTRTLKGEIGSGYETTEDGSIDISYEVSGIDGNTTGVFTKEPQEVVYKYATYVPETILNADFDDDKAVNVKDVTLLQLNLAKLQAFTDEQFAKADVNYDGNVDISDATMIQLHLAKFSVGTGTVEINYYDNETGKKIANSETIRGRVGSVYSSSPKVVLAYTIDEGKLPENADEIIAYGHTKDINYYYNYSGQKQTIHIRYSDDTTTEKELNIWPWQANVPKEDGTKGEVNLSTKGEWPGDKVSTEKDEAGWMTVSLDTPGVGEFCFILSTGSGSPQTADYVRYTQLELWVVVNGNNMTDKGNWMDVYDVDPIANPNAKPLPVYNS